MKNKLNGFYGRYGIFLYAAVAFALILCVLFAGDDVGLSNNGDFQRVMEASGLALSDMDYEFTYKDSCAIRLTESSAIKNILKILFDWQSFRDYPSVHVLLVRLSVVVNIFVARISGSDTSVYRFAVLGVMYALLYALALAYLFSRFRLKGLLRDVLLKAAATVVLCDVAYITYFNSMYGEPLQHIALVFYAAVVLHALTCKDPGRREAVLGAIAGCVYGWTKFFNIPVAVLLIVAVEGIIAVKSARRRAPVIAGTAALCVLLLFYIGLPSWMDNVTSYNAVFYGIVREVDEDTAREYLSDMGLPEDMARYRDTSYYVSWVPGALIEDGFEDEAADITKTDIVRFYVAHPKRALQVMGTAIAHSGLLRPFYLANYGEGHSRVEQTNRFSLWCELRSRAGFDTWLGNLAVFAAFCALALLYSHGKRGRLRTGLLLLLLFGALAYCAAMPMLLNGEGDLSKHQFAFMELMDLLFLTVLVAAAEKASKRGGRVLCLLMLAALLLSPVYHAADSAVKKQKNHDSPEVGAFVELGELDGAPLVWQVISAEGDGVRLLCTEAVASLEFDGDNSGFYAESDVRGWLNSEFLDCFTVEERALLQEFSHRVLLSQETLSEAEAGYTDFTCSHLPRYADRDAQISYQLTLTDRAALPGIEDVSRLSRAGYDISGEYWLNTPYFRNGYMVRCVRSDDYILFAEADTVRGVRPMICISRCEAVSGSGSLNTPFALS